MGRTLTTLLGVALGLAGIALVGGDGRPVPEIAPLAVPAPPVSARAPGPAPAADPGPVLHGGFEAVTPPTRHAPFGDAPHARSESPTSAPLALGRGVRAQLAVHVERPAGWPHVAGDLYALPPGHAGRNDSDRFPWTYWDSREDEVALLDLPDSGPWDVILDTPWGTASAHCVEAPDGRRTRTDLRWPAMASMAFRLVDVPPPGVQVELTIADAQNDMLWGYPGAGAAGEVEWRSPITSGRVLHTPALRLRRRYHVDASFQRTAAAKHPPLTIVPTVVTHPAGEPIPLRLVAAAFLTTAPQVPTQAPAHWGAWRPTIDLHIADAHGFVQTEALDITVEDGRIEVDHDDVQIAPGRVSVAWTGRGIRPGRLDDVQLAPGARGVVRPRIAWDREVAPPPIPRRLCTLRVEGVANGQLSIAAMLRNRHDEPDAWERDLDVVNGHLELSREYARSTSVMVYRGMGEASWPVRTDRPAPKPLRLHPAGHLVVVPDRAVHPDLGGLRLRRKDGGPTLTCSIDGGELRHASAHREVEAEPGLVLGPLPAGEHVFEVRLGLRRLPDATAVVRAHRVEVLRVRW